MIKAKVETAINNQINKELYSYYLYLSMAAHFESNNLKGFSHWLRVQANEESEHAMKLYDYLLQRGGRVVLQTIEAPPSNWKSYQHIFEDAYQHEQRVTGLIHELVELACAEKDYATDVFLEWFVSEQVEEETNALEVLQRVKLAGNEGGALLMLNSELGKRSAKD